MDFPLTFDVYFDDDSLEVNTSVHIKETIQESDAHRAFDATFKSVILDMEGLHTHVDLNNMRVSRRTTRTKLK